MAAVAQYTEGVDAIPLSAGKPDVNWLKKQLSLVAKTGNAPETIAGLAMLAEISPETVKGLVAQGSDEGLIILGKATGLSWHDMKDVLTAVLKSKMTRQEDVKSSLDKFLFDRQCAAVHALHEIEPGRIWDDPRLTSSDDIPMMR